MIKSIASPKKAREVALEVVRRLREAGYEALWAGGCVRDLLLNLEPDDYDVATNATPKDVVKLFGRRNTRMVGAAFGVVLYVDRRTGVAVEIATFRTDASYSDGRHPDSVTFSSPEEDARRRDFTINGMFFDPLNEETIDYVGGLADLKAGIIRAIGDPEARIAEDKLRMIRAVRFAARFRFSIEPQTMEAIRRHAAEINQVAPERITMELERIFGGNNAGEAVRLLAETRLLKALFPEISDSLCVEQAVAVIEQLDQQPWMLKFAALFVCLQDQESDWLEFARRIQRRFRLSNDAYQCIATALGSQKHLEQAHRIGWSRIQPLLVCRWGRESFQLLAARCRAGFAGSECGQAVELLRSKLALPAEVLDPAPLVTGEDLARIGIPRGPVYRTLITKVRAMQLDGEITSHQEALEWIQANWQQFTQDS